MANAEHITRTTHAGYGAWRIEWEGTPPFRIYDAGALWTGAPTTLTSGLFFTDADADPAIEILDADDTEEPQQTLHPAALILQWRGTPHAQYYRIEQYTGAAWTPRRNVPEIGLSYYQFTTPPQTDAIATLWRIVSVDRHGGESAPEQITATPAANPAPPALDLTYDEGTGLLTGADP